MAERISLFVLAVNCLVYILTSAFVTLKNIRKNKKRLLRYEPRIFPILMGVAHSQEKITVICTAIVLIITALML